jgi:hypothetical protein
MYCISLENILPYHKFQSLLIDDSVLFLLFHMYFVVKQTNNEPVSIMVPSFFVYIV